MKAVQGNTEESEKLNKMSSLLERLHVKFNPNSRPWTETMKLVRQVMEKRIVMNSGGHQNLITCLETLQKALKEPATSCTGMFGFSCFYTCCQLELQLVNGCKVKPLPPTLSFIAQC
uniref:Mediator complex subunit 1 n=1 Tax=Micrurus lemniscatus lemniscatus TaxID=129467 RepID=A0A2D4HDN0_MICLE